jgi:hypothetical protein
MSEGEVAHLGWVTPCSCEAEGEGGEDFYIARSGERADLLVSPRGARASSCHPNGYPV